MKILSTILAFNIVWKVFKSYQSPPNFQKMCFYFIFVKGFDTDDLQKILNFLDRVFFELSKKVFFWRDIQICNGLKSKGRLSYINTPLIHKVMHMAGTWNFMEYIL